MFSFNNYCPRCEIQLSYTNSKFGRILKCKNCLGSFYQRSHIFQKNNSKLIALIHSNLEEIHNPLNIKCPKCAINMVQIIYPYKAESTVLDVCPTCKGIWFDEKETKVLKVQPITDTSLKEKVKISKQFTKIPRDIHHRDLENIIDEIRNNGKKIEKNSHNKFFSKSSNKFTLDIYSLFIIHLSIIMLGLNLYLDMNLQKQVMGIMVSFVASIIVRFIFQRIKDIIP
ncbi:MAG: zf-TFIIB domain-containing protein [Leptospiraceae bacterium]|nr:zf-TFIIB domain-containing protein [Leptospiraceae bacterium]MCZ8347199.1 zf-TFIIB domain-containing protein [Leptospiraceae bacterium]